MRLRRFLICPLLLLSNAVSAGSAVPASYYAELDGTFLRDRPGMAVVPFDLAGSSAADFGIQAFSDPNNGSVLMVSQVDINHADSARVAIGLSRQLYSGANDNGFQTSGKRTRDVGMVAVVDACMDEFQRVVVAGYGPGLLGGDNDLILARFNADGSDDNSFSGDGFHQFSVHDQGGGYPEAVLDLECLPAGQLLLTGWFEDADGFRGAFLGQMNEPGSSVVRSYKLFGSASTSIEGAAVTQVPDAYAWALQRFGSTNLATLQYMFADAGNSFDLAPEVGVFNLGQGNSCPGGSAISKPRWMGLAVLQGYDVVLTGLRDNAGVNVPFLARYVGGESQAKACLDLDFGLSDAAITPPLFLSGHVFVGLGFQPFAGGPLPSRLRAITPAANAATLSHASSFGFAGRAEWNFPHAGAVTNSYSFIQRLYADPAQSLMAVGSRRWNGADHDAALTRLGSRGMFNDGMEDLVE